MTVHGMSAGFGRTLAVLGLGAGLFLTGCSGQAGPVLATEGPTATAAATPTATPGPTEAARPSAPATVTDVYISATSIEVRDGSGEVLATFDYFQPASELVSGLTTAFGSAPLSEAYESTNSEQNPGTRYTWGNAFPEDPETGRAPSTWGDFVLTDDDQAGAPPFYSNTIVVVSAESVNGIRISTVDDIAVGDNAAEIAARYPGTSQPSGAALDVGVGAVPLPPSPDGPEADRTWSVRLRAPDPLGPITSLVAPSPSWGV